MPASARREGIICGQPTAERLRLLYDVVCGTVPEGFERDKTKGPTHLEGHPG